MIGKLKPTKAGRPKRVRRPAIDKFNLMVNRFGADEVQSAVLGYTYIKCECDCKKFGHDEESMMEWVNAIPEKMRGRIDWL